MRGLVILFVLLLASPASAGNCQLRTYHHAKQVVAYQVPIVQNFYYGVGAGVQVEAAVQKAIRTDPDFDELQAFKRWKQSLQAPSPDQWKSLATGQPVAGSLPDGTPDLIIKAKCASCHGPDDSLTLDGSKYISAATYQRFSEMALTGHDVPAKMKPVLGSLQGDDLTNILVELLKLKEPAPTAADTEPEEDEPGVLK
jgi:hypothetical protein